MRIVKISRALDAAFTEGRARNLADPATADPSAPWREVCEILAAQPPLLAVFTALLFRDSLIADEGLYAAASFTDYLLDSIPNDEGEQHA